MGGRYVYQGRQRNSIIDTCNQFTGCVIFRSLVVNEVLLFSVVHGHLKFESVTVKLRAVIQ